MFFGDFFCKYQFSLGKGNVPQQCQIFQILQTNVGNKEVFGVLPYGSLKSIWLCLLLIPNTVTTCLWPRLPHFSTYLKIIPSKTENTNQYLL